MRRDREILLGTGHNLPEMGRTEASKLETLRKQGHLALGIMPCALGAPRTDKAHCFKFHPSLPIQ